MPGIFTAYEPVFRRAIHIVMTVTGLLLIAGLWELDLFAMAQHSLLGIIASSLLGIGIVLLAAYMLWGITAAAIDRRLQSEVSSSMASRRHDFARCCRFCALQAWSRSS